MMKKQKLSLKAYSNINSCSGCFSYDFIMPQNNPHDQYNYWGCIKDILLSNPKKCKDFQKAKND